jgi:hypothetical protein
MTEYVSTNLLGRTAVWYDGGRGRDGGTIVAVTFYQGGFILLIATEEGLRTKNASGVRIE